MTTDGDIDLRLKRAGKHLKELEGLVRPFEHGHPHDIREGIEGKHKEYVYRLYFAEHPHEDIPVVFGDFLHNLRSALNYLMRGLVPSSRRNKTQFPIFARDPFARDPVTRRYIERDPEQRRTWKRYVEGVHPQVLAYMQEIQPYGVQRRPDQVHLMTAIQWLSNSDKHRELIKAMPGLEDAYRTVRIGRKETVADATRVMRDGAEIYRSQSPVHVEFDGTPRVLIRVGGRDGGMVFADAATDLLLYTRGMVINILRGYLQR